MRGAAPGRLRLSRHLFALALAIVAAGGLLTVPAGASAVRAAAPDLTIVTDATYEVQPEQHRVRVTVDMVLTNHLRDSATRRYYFDRAFMAVLPDASDYRLSWSGGGKPGVSVSKKTAKYTVLDLKLGERIYSGKSAKYQLVFDLLDKGGAATRDVRIGTALVSFPVWAYATDSTSGSTVRVVFPAGFETEVQAGDIPEPTTDDAGRVIFQTGRLAKPVDFFAYLVGDRAGAYANQSVVAQVGPKRVDVTVRAWPDDKAWSDRVSALVTRALPVLSARIGQPWPRDGGLVIQEAVGRSTGGYAGLFDPGAGKVEIAYFADDPVVLHESAHAWFNGSLLADRWANEAFASYYGFETARDLGVDGKPDALTPELEKSRIPLNAWGPVGRDVTATEDYAYAASIVLARAIAERAGDASLKAVWADASAHVGAYQPPAAAGAGAAGAGAAGAAAAPETVDDPPDWRGLLDLLDGHTGKSFEDLWRTWVTRPSDVPLLDARRAARARYDDVVAKAADWRLPKAVRDAMRAWRFDDATALLHDATSVLAERNAIEGAAAKAGLTPPTTLRTAFEAPDGFAAATQEASAERAAIDRYAAAAASRIAAPDPFETLGLWGTTPDSELAAARDAFAAGDLAGSVGAAEAAAATWSSAAELGRGRALSIAAGTLAVLLALGLVIALIRGFRRRRRAAAAGVLAAEGATIDATGPEAWAVPGDVAGAGSGLVDEPGQAAGAAPGEGSDQAVGPALGEGPGLDRGQPPDDVASLPDGRSDSDAEVTVAGDVPASPAPPATPVDGAGGTLAAEGDAGSAAGAPRDATAPHADTTTAGVDAAAAQDVPALATAPDQPTERVPVTDAYATLAATSPAPEAQPGDEAQTGA